MKSISIIPKPVKVELVEGNFILSQKSRIFHDLNSNSSILIHVMDFISNELHLNLVVHHKEKLINPVDAVILLLDKAHKDLPKEGYLLQINLERIEIIASEEMGLFYGLQTLKQLIYSNNELIGEEKSHLKVPCLRIEDSPRFSWRGFMLDESRHFFGRKTVFKILDIMALFKLNVFHWHLTDDQGWRIQVEKYPKLTELGSSRRSLKLKASSRKRDGIFYSGFYTQEEIKEIVMYASKRFITIIPEIDIPGHTVSVLASYPDLGCMGKEVEVSTRFGIHEDVLCIGNVNTIKFVKDVLDDVLNLFPSRYIHVGGDEVPKTRWKECTKCQAKIITEKLKDEEELQMYFTNSIATYLESKHRNLIGWNEIVHDGLIKSAAFEYWFGDLDTIAKELRNGRKGVFSQDKEWYFNNYYKRVPLKQTYLYEPFPNDLENEFIKNIMGIEACLWTEFILDEKTLEWATFPKLLAISESAWTQKGNKNYDSFLLRLEDALKILDNAGVKHALRNEVDP
jgi:hexosaminidase